MADSVLFLVRPGVLMLAALPYDVYNREEATAVVAANPDSFLAIDRAHGMLLSHYDPDPVSDAVLGDEAAGRRIFLHCPDDFRRRHPTVPKGRGSTACTWTAHGTA